MGGRRPADPRLWQGRLEPTCLLNHEVVLWLGLAMGIFTDVPIRQVFKLCRRFRACETSPNRLLFSGYFKILKCRQTSASHEENLYGEGGYAP